MKLGDHLRNILLLFATPFPLGAIVLCLTAGPAHAQQAVTLPVAPAVTEPVRQTFTFASDGPIGPGWTRPDEIARTYFADELPALFRRTLVLNGPVPHHGKLLWIFTGPHAGFTIELSQTKLRVFQRFYNSTGLASSGSYPEHIVHDDEQQFIGEARTLTVVVDAHLSLEVLVNGAPLLRQACVFDLLRHQLQFSAPRTEHLTLAGALLADPPQPETVTIDPSVHHQTMQGFGGSPSIPAYEHLSAEGKRQYWALLKNYNLLIDREYPMGSELKPDLSNREDLRDATPHYYGDNFPNGEISDFAYNKQAQALGGEVLYEMWALPSWAQQPYAGAGQPILDAWNKRVRSAAKPEEFARIVVDYCRAALARTGAPPAIVGIQNEVEQPPEVFAEMTITLRRELDKAGFQSVKIQMADAPYTDMAAARARELHLNLTAWSHTDFAASHEYDYQEFFANPDLYDAHLLALHSALDGKPYLATEICINDPKYQEPSYRIAFNVGQLYEKNLTELDAEMLLYCWLLLDVEEPTFGGSRSLLVPDKSDGNLPVASSFQLRVLGAYSRHVLRGMQRIDSTSSSPDLLSVAFAGGGHTTLVLQNRSPEPMRISLAAFQFTELERTSQTQANTTADTVPAELGIASGEIVTLFN